ncbi:hypothetical protein F4804DRAFT_314338 [Jackrogersella minutella]|nr:hypothetical protein F4804DRAFT_314338 [Jackrogersella minutella]
MSLRDELYDTAEALRECFSLDNRYNYRRMVAAGGFGSAHRVQYVNPDTQVVFDFLVKKAHDDDEAEEALMIEKNYLLPMRGGMHIAQLIVEIPDDPLEKAASFGGLRGEWIFLEWVPNGTLYDFVEKARLIGVERLPNRLLWRFFLCLIRACCGMAWPRNRHDGMVELELPEPGEPLIGIAHNDLHTSNVLLGDFEIAGEHGITPILKIIDFGLSTDSTELEHEDIKETNLWEVGKIMLQLITLDLDTTYATTPVTIDYLGQNVQTRANPILPPSSGSPSPFPWLDQWLATVVSLCVATQFDGVPTLQTLSVIVPYAVRERNGEFYGVPEESDQAIRDLCQEILYAPAAR